MVLIAYVYRKPIYPVIAEARKSKIIQNVRPPLRHFLTVLKVVCGQGESWGRKSGKKNNLDK